jgi:hypothetical protein
MTPMRAKLSSLVLALLVSACSSKTVVVPVPPRVDLQPYQTIGVVDFTGDRDDRLGQAATQRFMAVIQSSQPNVRFLELGPAVELLRSAGRERIDPETMRIVGKRHGVDTVFTGGYELSSLKPQLTVGQDLASLSASARVRMSLRVKQWDTKSGATLWTNASHGEWPVARVSRGAGQPVALSVSDPEARYGDFMAQLVEAVTDDFRVHYERRPVTTP